ncbi:MAG: flavodoxin family protein [Solirubrobacteraceae bacterium]
MASEKRRVLVLCASPRRDGNTWMLTDHFLDGARAAGHHAEAIDLGRAMNGVLRDCRSCRRPDGRCSIEDEYPALIHDLVLPADALVYATPLYWYGMSATLKNFFDRLVCYVSASYPRRDEVAEGLKDKRTALLLASEERYPAAALSLIGQLQEISRYFHHRFVGVVNGIGNTRGEVRFDPADPLGAARELGAGIFEFHHSDYDLDAERPNAVWRQARATVQDAVSNPYEDT